MTEQSLTPTGVRNTEEKLEATVADRLTKLLLIKFKTAYGNRWDSQIKARGDAQALEHNWKITLANMLSHHTPKLIAESINLIASGEVSKYRNPNFIDFPPTMPQFVYFVKENEKKQKPKVYYEALPCEIIAEMSEAEDQKMQKAISECTNPFIKTRLEKLKAKIDKATAN